MRWWWYLDDPRRELRTQFGNTCVELWARRVSALYVQETEDRVRAESRSALLPDAWYDPYDVRLPRVPRFIG